MKIKEAIEFIKNTMYIAKHDDIEEDDLLTHQRKYNHWMRYVIELLQRGEKYEQIVKEMKLNNPYPESIFPEIPTNDLAIIHDFLRREMGFPIDRLSGHLGRKIYNSIIEELKAMEKEHKYETRLERCES